MKMMKSKKGLMSLDLIMQGAVRMIEYIIAFSALFAIASLLILTKIDTGTTEGQLLVNRIIYSAAAKYDEETGRTYPGILDEKLLNKEALSKRIKPEIKAASSIKAEEIDVIYNEYLYNYLSPLAESQIPGKSAKATEQELNLIIIKDEKEKNEEVSFITVTPT